MIERSCILVKPDGVGQKHVGQVLARLEQAGLKLIGLKLVRLAREQAEQFYAEHQGRPFYGPLIEFMTSAPIVASVWEADNVIERSRAIIGATDSKKAAKGTLRGDFGTDNRRNLVHGSDSAKSADREIPFFFTPEELQSYGENDWDQAVSPSTASS